MEGDPHLPLVFQPNTQFRQLAACFPTLGQRPGFTTLLLPKLDRRQRLEIKDLETSATFQPPANTHRIYYQHFNITKFPVAIQLICDVTAFNLHQ